MEQIMKQNLFQIIHTHTYKQESEIIASHRPIMQLNTLHTHSNLKGKTVPTEISLNKW